MKAILADKAQLTRILTYHVVSGKVTVTDAVKLQQAKTVEGQSLKITTLGGVKVDGAYLTATDIMATNGVIHVVDTVLLPQ